VSRGPSADAHRRTVDRNFDRSDEWFVPMLSPRLALQMSRGTGRCRIYDRRHEPHFVVFGNDRLSFPDLPPPAKQLLRRQSVSPRHAGNRVAAALDLGDHPRLVLVAPGPPASRTSENLQPASRLSDRDRESTRLNYSHLV